MKNNKQLATEKALLLSYHLWSLVATKDYSKSQAAKELGYGNREFLFDCPCCEDFYEEPSCPLDFLWATEEVQRSEPCGSLTESLCEQDHWSPWRVFIREHDIRLVRQAAYKIAFYARERYLTLTRSWPKETTR